MKKSRKISLIILLIILLPIVGTIGYLYVSFNYFSLEDNYEVTQNNLAYFNESYDEARSDFLEQTVLVQKQYANSQYIKVGVPHLTDTDLTIDMLYIPSTDSLIDKIFILSSGVHGVEGYVGSAVQLFFMDNYLTDELLAKTSVLLIHSVNPYGFKYSRRVSENNVDLNRNSDTSEELYAIINEGYPQVYDLINPKGEADVSSMSNRFFFLKAIQRIVESGMPVLRQSILQGQYQYPEGLYFGGQKAEAQITSLIPVIDSLCEPYNTIFAVDLHTGYGARGQLHLFPNPVEDDMRARMNTLFDGFHIDWGDSGDFYTVTGDFVNYIGKINAGKTFIPMAFEYGTMDSQTTIGSLKSIHTMILENQGVQYGYASAEDSVEIKKNLVEMYYPASEAWRSHVIDETKNIFDIALTRFSDSK